MKRVFSLIVLVLAAAMLAGCGTRITGVTLTVPSTLERGAVGEVIPEYTYDGDTPEADEAAELAEKQGLRYASSDPEVVEVDEEGLLTALSAGTAEITLTSEDGELSASGTVTVTDPAVKEDAAVESSGSSGAAGGDGYALTLPTGYGAVPFSLANGSGTWWGIESTDSAFTAVLDGINAYRAAAGVSPLTVADDLTAIADQRCGQLVDTGLTHDGSTTTEIIGQNARTGQDIVAA